MKYSDNYTFVAPTKLDKVLNKHILLFKEGLGRLTDVSYTVKYKLTAVSHLSSSKSEAFTLKAN